VLIDGISLLELLSSIVLALGVIKLVTAVAITLEHRLL
jgi:hypothetical protein